MAGNPRLQRVRADVGDGLGDEAEKSETEGDESPVASSVEGEDEMQVSAASALPIPLHPENPVVQNIGAASGRGQGRGGRRQSRGRRALAAQPSMRRLPDTLHPRNAGV